MKIKAKAAKGMIILSAVFGIILNGNITVTAEGFEEPDVNTMAPVNFINGGFEEPNIMTDDVPGACFTTQQIRDNNYYWNFFPMERVPGWSTRVVNQEHAGDIWAEAIEIDRSGFGGGINAFEGGQFAELNANVPGILYQECDTKPGEVIYWEFYHTGRSAVEDDEMIFMLNGEEITKAKSNKTAWKRYYGAYLVPDSQYQTEFAFKSEYSALGNLASGNLLDAVRLFNPAFLEVSKQVETPDADADGSYAMKGDTVTYRIQIQNTGETETSRTIMTDKLPEGVAFIEDSVSIIYIDAEGEEEAIDPAGLVTYDSAGHTVTAACGLEISGAVITDPDTGINLPNNLANGTRSIEQNGAMVTISFDVRVTGEGVEHLDLLQNQVRVTYNDLGFEKFNLDQEGEITDKYNVSPVASYEYRERAELTIKKDLTAPDTIDRMFIFYVDYGVPSQRGFYVPVTVDAGQLTGSAVVTELQHGDYRIEELVSSWQYAIVSESDLVQYAALNRDNRLETLDFTNEKEVTNWTEGSAHVTNQMEE